jgi:hypothetical protein
MLISNRQKVPDFGQSPLLDFTIIHILIFVALSEAFVPHQYQFLNLFAPLR